MLKAYYQKTLIEAGCDEAGRGCYAGPVFAAAVILPKKFKHPLVKDSKQLTADQRAEARAIIEEHALSYAVAMVSEQVIDEINILKASFKAMHLAIEQLRVIPEFLLIDGNRFVNYPFIQHTCIVKGDGLYASIAAASILAKTSRDAYMHQLHDEFPHYNWKQNKGYGTLEHREAISKHGICKYHRKSFSILPEGEEPDEAGIV
ncbi:ribonuclease HII [Deminuibacter soli]|uniref:Ribonuclease HII n=1 Tax=Deminuibacter soli TaxID=2291815 RepID=A0A3E1NR59_9BACT|nr:ribonuclease HII [Deminuibacter soli]RFM30426.1 ribonuclease HII [Deminuibacter soli]